MADEITIRGSLTVRKVSNSVTLIDERINEAYTDTMDGTKGPTPGYLLIPVGGKVISFVELTTPGWCVIHNCDEENYVEWGIYDPQTDLFYPVGEIGPGQSAGPFELSRNLAEEYVSTGTGTSGPTNQFFMKANTADVGVIIKAFEK